MVAAPCPHLRHGSLPHPRRRLRSRLLRRRGRPLGTARCLGRAAGSPLQGDLQRLSQPGTETRPRAQLIREGSSLHNRLPTTLTQTHAKAALTMTSSISKIIILGCYIMGCY